MSIFYILSKKGTQVQEIRRTFLTEDGNVRYIVETPSKGVRYVSVSEFKFVRPDQRMIRVQKK